VSLASLGAVQSLRFSLASSDTGEYGINTPAYFAMDNLSVTAVPEPSACLLALAGVFMVAGLRRRALAKP
jgi:MYXO-CTERM domain-containing protein